MRSPANTFIAMHKSNYYIIHHFSHSSSHFDSRQDCEYFFTPLCILLMEIETLRKMERINGFFFLLLIRDKDYYKEIEVKRTSWNTCNVLK